MLSVTDAALHHLHAALKTNGAVDGGSCFRLALQGQEALALVIAEPESGDETFECEGDTVLASPDPLSELLTDRVLDLDGDGQLVLLPKVS